MNLQLPAPTDKPDYKLLSDVREFGWHALHIVSKDVEIPNFTYTVGLTYSYDLPELVIVGLSTEISHGIISDAVEMMKNGVNFSDGTRISGLISKGDCLIRKVTKEEIRSSLCYNGWFYQNSGAEISALQILWPDRAGFLPGDSEFDHTYSGIQKLK